MSAPFCTACGATAAEGTRFCVKCGQPVGQAAPPPQPISDATVHIQAWTPPPPSTPSQPLPPPVPPMAEPVTKSSSAGIWIAVFGFLLLIGGVGLWVFTVQWPKMRAAARQVAAVPPAQPEQPLAPALAPAPAPAAAPEATPRTPDAAPPNAAPNDAAPKDATPKDATPKDATPKDAAPLPLTPKTPPKTPPVMHEKPLPVESQPVAPAPAPPPDPAPVTPTRVKPRQPTSGVLHASVEVAQYGEVVFDNLPGARLKFTFDHAAWQPTISRQPNGTQTLVMRSLKPGIQRTCDVRWEIVQ